MADDEKYISRLEGEQIDDALEQMNQRIPEGWAVGERDGVPVTSESPFYENNAKYYAEQAGEKAAEIEAALDDYVTKEELLNAYVTDTAQGDIITIPDGADNIPVKSLIANIEPIQDLHGYDHPWPAGGGKNKLPMTVDALKAANTSFTWSGNAATKNGVTFTIQTDAGGNVAGINLNGTASAQTDFALGTPTDTASAMILNGCPTSGSGSTYRLIAPTPNGNVVDYNGSGVSAPNGVNGTVIIRINASATASNALFKPMLRLASVTDATFAPYSNICPISGWTGAEVTRTGKNLLSGYYANSAINGSGVRYTTQDSTLTHIVRVEPGATYTMSGTKTAPNTYIQKFDQHGGYLGYQRIGSSLPLTFTVPSDTYWIYVQFNATGAGAVLPENGQLEIGSTATAYEPFGAVYPVTWQTEAGTVYGGELNVTTGVLTVTQRAFTVTDSTVFTEFGQSAQYGSYAKVYITGALAPFRDANQTTVICDSAPGTSFNARTSNADQYRLYVEESYSAITFRASAQDNITAVGDLKAKYEGAMVVYELATPQTYQLDPVTVRTLLGVNIVWTDCGKTEMEYRADTALYIQKKLAEA